MTTDEQAPATNEEPKVGFFTLDPRKVGRKRLLRTLLLVLLFVSVSVVPLWQLGWYWPIYAPRAFLPTLDTHNRPRAAWHWIDGKEIRVYGAPGVPNDRIITTADGVRAMVEDAGLAINVHVLPMPEPVLSAYRQSLVQGNFNGQRRQMISFNRLERRLIELRDGDPHADVLVVPESMTESWWAFGMATFTSGVGVLVADNVSFHLGKHETGHLLGYLVHDSLPLFVIGYPWEGMPFKVAGFATGPLAERNTLMLLYSDSNDLSPRARDALHYFWRGIERRSGKRFLE
jgi:hypothetical protein